MIKGTDLIVREWSSKPKSNWVPQPGQGISVYHKPTGIEVTCEKHRSQYKNRDECIRELVQRIAGL